MRKQKVRVYGQEETVELVYSGDSTLQGLLAVPELFNDYLRTMQFAAEGKAPADTHRCCGGCECSRQGKAGSRVEASPQLCSIRYPACLRHLPHHTCGWGCCCVCSYPTLHFISSQHTLCPVCTCSTTAQRLHLPPLLEHQHQHQHQRSA